MTYENLTEDQAARECCGLCHGGGWVCENHPDHAWAGTANVEECCGGAGMPCGACHLEMASAGYVDRREKQIADWIERKHGIDWLAELIRTGKHWGEL